jgi:hypothetical protein
MNWQGKPLVSYEFILNLLGATRTKGGLRIKPRLDLKEYEKGIEFRAEEMESISIEPHKAHPDWNYTILSHRLHKSRRHKTRSPKK